MPDPMSHLVGSLEREMLNPNHDQADEFHRLTGRTEGEIASYRQTRMLLQRLQRQKHVHPTFLGSINGIPIER